MSYSYSGNENTGGHMTSGSTSNTGRSSRLESQNDAYLVSQSGDPVMQQYASATTAFTNIPQLSAITSSSYDYGQLPQSQTSTNQILADVLRTQSRVESHYEPATQSANASTYLSSVEAAILRSSVPIDLLDSTAEEISVSGHRGIWLNKAEVANWRGLLPISQYTINEDSNPEIITKRTQQNLTYIQELAIRYESPFFLTL